MFSLKSVCLIIITCLFAGCGSQVGPENIRNERQDFNIALQQTNDEQMLLNLVRMKYRDTNMFLEVGAIASQYSLTSNITASGSLKDNFSNSIGLGTKIEYQEKPTISYTPLHGQSFITRLLNQVSPDTISLLYKSGWSVERLFLLCMERIQTVKNAPTASGPTPEYAPAFKDFKKMCKLFRDLQLDGEIKMDLVSLSKDPKVKSFGWAVTFNAKNDRTKQLKKLLGLSDADYYLLKQSRALEDHELNIETRSIREMLFYLSHAVEVPQKHIEQGLVTATTNKDGSKFCWKEVTGDLLQVKSTNSLIPPSNAYVSVRYRNAWFYIEDNDLNSKSTFALLIQLYDLQSGDSSGAAPVLTLPIGG